MIEHDTSDVRRHSAFDHFVTIDRMQLHEIHLRGGQLARLVEYFRRNLHFADVVEQ